MTNFKPVVINQIEYKSIGEACILNNISQSTLYSVKRQYKIDTIDAITKILFDRDNEKSGKTYKSSAKKSIEINGISFESISKALKYYGINDGQMRSKMYRYNMSTKQAIESIIEDREERGGRRVQSHTGELTIIDGCTYRSIRSAAEANGINYGTVKRYMGAYNLSGEEAIHKLMNHNRINVSGNRERTVVDGVEYESIKAATDAFGVNYGTVLHKTSMYGITVEEAIHELLNRGSTPKRSRAFIKTPIHSPSLQPKEPKECEVPDVHTSSTEDTDIINLVTKYKELGRQIADMEEQLLKKKAEHDSLKQAIIDSL